MHTVAQFVPLFDSDFFIALRQVAYGRIGAADKKGGLGPYGDELERGVFCALCTLERDGFVVIGQQHPQRPGWYTAILTQAGIRLLHDWTTRGSEPS